MKEVYLDHAATTPLAPEVYRAMAPYFKLHYGNPSSLYKLGITNKKVINDCRARIAHLLGAEPSEIYFCSGASEANNWALKGILLNDPIKGELITTPIEHHSVGHACDYLARLGVTVKHVTVDHEGFVSLDHLRSLLTPQTRLVSIIMANNEIGTIQPIKAIAELVHRHGALLHVDAVQAVGQIPINLKDLGADLVSFTAHKFNGPKGIGALYIKKGLTVDNLIHGGNQEMGARSGTENVALIVGLTKALELSIERLERDQLTRRELARHLWQSLQSSIPDVRLNGPAIGPLRLPGNVNICIKNTDSSQLLFELDKQGFYASSGSACNADAIEPSHVLQAIHVPMDYLSGALRLTLGHETTLADINRLVRALTSIIQTN